MQATWRHYAIPRKAAIGSVVDTVTSAAGALQVCTRARLLPYNVIVALLENILPRKIEGSLLSDFLLQFCACWHESELWRGYTTHKP